MARKLKSGEPMSVPHDQINTPTYNRDLAAATRLLVEAGATGVYNVGGLEVLGRLAFAQRLTRALAPALGGLDGSLLSRVATSNAGQAALRPLASGLTLHKTMAAIPKWKPRTVEEAIADWIANPRGKPLGE
jgi:dTDP-4-dehydrorhamnose reductase